MRIIQYIRCAMTNGHTYTNSRSRPGYKTCMRCRVRKRIGTIRNVGSAVP